MRTILAPLLLLPLLPSSVLAAPDVLAAFEPALDSQPAQNNDTLVEDGTLELLKRQTNPNQCADGYYACVNLNAPGLCCRRSQICSADANRNVACCPQGAACTGTIGGPGGQATGTPTITGASSTVPFIGATSTDSFVQQTGDASRSMVPNTYYPFAFIPTTYTNAAACSQAYSTCQSDAASCTAALASGQQGVTVSAPNGGVTVTAVPSLGFQSASAICASLSSRACYELQVEACVSFGGGQNAAPRTRCAEPYLMGAGVAVGIAGGFLR